MAAECVVLFDGVCNLCNRSVHFLLKQDHKQVFKFASLQSSYATNALKAHGESSPPTDSVILITPNGVFYRSEAVLQIVKRLPGWWSAMAVLGIIPRPIRDAIYNYIARKRYDWFGKRESCLVPKEEYQARFLDQFDGLK